MKNIVVSCIFVLSYLTLCSADSKEIDKVIRDISPCLGQSVYSFNYPKYRPPTTTDGLEKSCKAQAEAFKCLKDKNKNMPPMIKRGLVSFIQSRQRYNKKYCTNVNSDQSKQFLRDMKCILDKRLAQYIEIDAIFANTLLEIKRRNYSDASLELKYFCCTMVIYRTSLADAVGKECADSRPVVEELVATFVPSDINLICEDGDKLLTKVCPKLEPYKNISRTFDINSGISPAGTGFYITLTLGEPETATR